MYDINYKVLQITILGKISHKLLNGQNKLYAKSSNELSSDFIKEFMNFPLNSEKGL